MQENNTIVWYRGRRPSNNNTDTTLKQQENSPIVEILRKTAPGMIGANNLKLEFGPYFAGVEENCDRFFYQKKELI